MKLFCDNCERYFETRTALNYYDVWGYQAPHDIDTPFLYNLCSPSCLAEWGWKCKESQTKLSKSKETNDELA